MPEHYRLAGRLSTEQKFLTFSLVVAVGRANRDGYALLKRRNHCHRGCGLPPAEAGGKREKRRLPRRLFDRA